MQRPSPSGGREGPRLIAWEILWRAEKDSTYVDLLLDAVLERQIELDPRDRALITELVYGTLRWQGRLDWVIGALSRRPIRRIHPKLLVLLRLAAYQILFLERIPASAAVNEAVEISKVIGMGHASGFVNALLRRIVQVGGDVPFPDPNDDLAGFLSIYLSHPRWMVEMWFRDMGKEITEELLRANNSIPPLTLRTQTLKISRPDLLTTLKEEGLEVRPGCLSPEGIIVRPSHRSVRELRAYREGLFMVQDEASQLISHWLEPRPGERILDACAAPGGKTTHMAQLMEDKGVIVAIDRHKGRMKLLEEAMKRLELRCIHPLVADLLNVNALPYDKFQKILLDAPCSGLGVLRRHPEAKWRRTLQDIERMAELQLALLNRAYTFLMPGGILLYSVCTFTLHETHEVVRAFLEQHPDMEVLKGPGGLPPEARGLVDESGLFQTLPHHDAMDGFFGVRLKKD